MATNKTYTMPGYVGKTLVNGPRGPIRFVAGLFETDNEELQAYCDAHPRIKEKKQRKSKKATEGGED